YDDELDLYSIDCNADVTANVNIAGANFTIESTNLIIKIHDDLCILALHHFEMFWAAQFILGAPFIKQYCTVYDVHNKQIGFAKSLQ
ncbi:unnamed protein product, partial [Cylicostephanus goldi]